MPGSSGLSDAARQDGCAFSGGLVLKRVVNGVRTISMRTSAPVARSARIVVGVTHPQTCLVLAGRLRALRESGFDVTLVCSPGELLDSTAKETCVRAIGIPMERRISLLKDAVALVRLWWVLIRIRPDIVEFSTPKAGLLGTTAARLALVPVRVYLLRGLKLQTSYGIKRRVLQVAEWIASANAHVVLCNSRSLRTETLALQITSADKLHLLGAGSSNGVDVERYCPGEDEVRDMLKLPREAHMIGFVGRLTRDKGLPELIEAFDAVLRQEPNVYLMLVGWFDEAEDALDAALMEKILAHSRICCTGFVVDTAPYYRAMDMMVLPTWREGFPNVVLEAAATEIPVITTTATGARDAVVPEVTGLLVPPGYPEAIVEAMLELIRNKEKRERMGRAARIWVKKNFVEAGVLGMICEYYSSLLNLHDVTAFAAKEDLPGMASVEFVPQIQPLSAHYPEQCQETM